MTQSQKPKNILSKPLAPCCFDPVTGFYRDGHCKTGFDDTGRHLVCAKVTKEFLEFSVQVGNDLSTPRPEYLFPGLKPGDKWCVCVLRWKQAYEAGVAPPIVLESTHENALRYLPIQVWQEYAIRSSENQV